MAFGGDHARSAGYALHVEWTNSLLTPEAIALNRFVESPFPHPSVMFRRALIDSFGGYAEGPFPEDYELWLRWLEAGVRMAKVAKTLLTWHDSPGRLSRVDPRYSTEAFYRCKAGYLALWIEAHVPPTRSILVWGAGRLTRKRVGHLSDHGVQIQGYIDIDPHKIGRRFSHRPVIGLSDLPKPDRCFVLGCVAKRGARELARVCLLSRGFTEGKDFIAAA